LRFKRDYLLFSCRRLAEEQSGCLEEPHLLVLL
jgi:hypothetical protein